MPEGPDRIDYQETPDISEVHASIQREHSEPSAQVTPIPVWLTVLCAVLMVWAGTYFGVFHGGLSGSVFNEYDSSPAVLFPIPETAGKAATAAAAEQTLAELGKGIYSNCVPCHQTSGAGVAGQFPPLIKSEWVVGSEKRLVAILLKGLQGEVEVEGKKFNGAMPAWETTLSNKKIAAVLSFVRSNWGNQAPEVSEAKVAAARKEFAERKAPWSQAELTAIPADATLPDAGAAKDGAKDPAAPAAAPASPAAAPGAAAPVAGSAAVTGAALDAQIAAGKAVYSQLCIACHQPNGLGLPMVFPPLAKSEYVIGDAKRFAAMILKGVMGPITVDGKLYNSIMPPQEAMLTDKKIADVITYVRASFGNSAGAVAPEVVASARQEFLERKTSWTEEELKNFGSAPEAAAPAAPDRAL